MVRLFIDLFENEKGIREFLVRELMNEVFEGTLHLFFESLKLEIVSPHFCRRRTYADVLKIDLILYKK